MPLKRVVVVGFAGGVCVWEIAAIDNPRNQMSATDRVRVRIVADRIKANVCSRQGKSRPALSLLSIVTG
jgi:hypothetical protein